MKGSRFSEEQIIAILREQEAGGANRRGVPAARDLECWRVAVELRFYIPASEIISRIKA